MPSMGVGLVSMMDPNISDDRDPKREPYDDAKRINTGRFGTFGIKEASPTSDED